MSMATTSNDWRMVFEEFELTACDVLYRVELIRLFGAPEQTPLVRWLNDKAYSELVQRTEDHQPTLKIIRCERYERAA